MFNDSNVDNRLRYPVRGRVIVFTTSRNVEFLQDGLKFSYPLYSVPYLPAEHGLAFCVELNGYLTFEANSQVKITPELAPFENYHYDPNGFAVVRAADSRPPLVIVRIAQQFPGNNQYDVRYYVRWSDGTQGTCAGPATFTAHDVVGKDQANAELHGFEFDTYGDV